MNIACGILLQKLAGVRLFRALALCVQTKNLRSLLEVVLYSAVFIRVLLGLILQLITTSWVADPYLHSLFVHCLKSKEGIRNVALDAC